MQTRLASIHAHRAVVAVVMTVVAAFGGALVLSLTSAAFARNRVPANVTVAGLTVGSVSLLDARTELATAVAAYANKGVVVTNGAEQRTVQLADLGVTIDIDETLQRAAADQQENMLFGVFALPTLRSAKDLPLAASVDGNQFKRFVAEEELRGSTPPVNARIVLHNGAASVAPEKDGVRQTVQTSVAEALRATSALTPLVVTKASEPWPASVRSEDLRDTVALYSTAVSAPVTMIASGRRWQMTVADIEHWLVPAVQGSATLEGADFAFAEHFVASFLQPVADAIHIPAKDTFGFHSETVGVYAYKNSLGRVLDRDEALKRILAALQQTSSRNVELPVVDEQPNIAYREVTAPRSDGKVIMVGLEEQTLFAFDNGKLVYWTRVSTGKAPRPTPPGTWKIYSKTTIQKMSGPGYYLPNVRWVMAYNGDYTLHGAYWHHNFGHPMSHGCTNMFDEDAHWLFNWSSVGTPVVIVASAE